MDYNLLKEHYLVNKLTTEPMLKYCLQADLGTWLTTWWWEKVTRWWLSIAYELLAMLKTDQSLLYVVDKMMMIENRLQATVLEHVYALMTENAAVSNVGFVLEMEEER